MKGVGGRVYGGKEMGLLEVFGRVELGFYKL